MLLGTKCALPHDIYGPPLTVSVLHCIAVVHCSAYEFQTSFYSRFTLQKQPLFDTCQSEGTESELEVRRGKGTKGGSWGKRVRERKHLLQSWTTTASFGNSSFGWSFQSGTPWAVGEKKKQKRNACVFLQFLRVTVTTQTFLKLFVGKDFGHWRSY